ncbi:DUF2779 domain-containing protein [Anaerorhabdus sp.]|uniref:DUF2779 domain-containing protein n=1 Tax=Anaerorhabdus sp. TaxID=1872524 RepID=UPI002FC58D56
MYHISDVKKYLRCPKLFWLSHYEKSLPFNSYVRLDEAVTTLACEKLGVTDCFLGARGDEASKALLAMNDNEWIVKGRFEAKQLRAKIPFLHKTNNGWDVYFLFCGNRPKDDDMNFYCSSIWVLEENDIKINQIYILHFDENYVRSDELDPHQLFQITADFFNDKGNPSKNVKDTIFKRLRNLEDILNGMDEVLQLDKVECTRQNKCTKKNKCRFYDKCFPNEIEVEADSILTLVSSQHKYDMHHEGRLKLKDVDLERIEGSRQQFAQIRASQNDGLYVDYYSLKIWIEKIKFPITFLDFEWETYAIPPFKGMKPYDVLPFEYSIHILYEDGTIEHKEYLGTRDCRRHLAENLMKDIPANGTIVAYNAEGAEKIRLKEMAAQFPEYAKELMILYKRLVDLAFPFVIGTVYDVRMRGYYSLKVLMSLMENQSGYQDLDIHQGMDAVFQWRLLDQENDDVDPEAIRNHLIEYCSMDTYAMVVVYKWLMSLVDNYEK